MSTVWDRFDSIASAEDVIEATSSFTPIEAGEYAATLDKIQATESKSSGLPMLATCFRLDNNRVVYFNQMLQNLNYPSMTAVNIAEAVKLIQGVTGTEFEFTGLADLASIVEATAIGGRFKIKISYGAKDLNQSFPKLAILEKLADDLAEDELAEDDLPF